MRKATNWERYFKKQMGDPEMKALVEEELKGLRVGLQPGTLPPQRRSGRPPRARPRSPGRARASKPVEALPAYQRAVAPAASAVSEASAKVGPGGSCLERGEAGT